jgi:hypothetical protein
MNEDILKRLQACAIAGCSPPERALALEAAKEIARLRKERRWVPVEERLPEIGTDVLAMGSEGVFQAYLTLWGESPRWEALVLDVHGCGCCGGESASVTHWMPLPPGPEAAP